MCGSGGAHLVTDLTCWHHPHYHSITIISIMIIINKKAYKEHNVSLHDTKNSLLQGIA